jgi:hypothetical protein
MKFPQAWIIFKHYSPQLFSVCYEHSSLIFCGGLVIKKILLGLALVLIGLVLYAAFVAPTNYRTERTLQISATPAQIYPHLANTKLANAWNPFLLADPETQVTYEGVESGVGAKTSWVSKKMGSGSATIIETVPNQLVKVRLDFIKPFTHTDTAEYSIKTVDGRSQVTWAMYGKAVFIQRFFCLFMDHDKLVGSQFEIGLQTLKDRVRATASL